MKKTTGFGIVLSTFSILLISFSTASAASKPAPAPTTKTTTPAPAMKNNSTQNTANTNSSSSPKTSTSNIPTTPVAPKTNSTTTPEILPEQNTNGSNLAKTSPTLKIAKAEKALKSANLTQAEQLALSDANANLKAALAAAGKNKAERKKALQAFKQQLAQIKIALGMQNASDTSTAN